ncbi:MAG: transposase domain-containing protein [Acetobacteraceae bacterium]|jgi:transposase
MSSINPHAYLSDVLGRIADHPIHKIDALLPWLWTQ